MDTPEDLIKRLTLSPIDGELINLTIAVLKRYELPILKLTDILSPIHTNHNTYSLILFGTLHKNINLQFKNLTARITYQHGDVNPNSYLVAIIDGFYKESEPQSLFIKPCDISFDSQIKNYPNIYFTNVIFPVRLSEVRINKNNSPYFLFVRKIWNEPNRLSLNLKHYLYFASIPGAYADFVQQNPQNANFL